ncbi:PREDICTED: serine/threonine-protein kinase 10-like [Amphimedon queenslandica]|nr:PREDICTED: serine/threonine-protein kinase 10-like [Amphimedon queenslandica]|eukprot:XP_003383893.1 PREDICTED: serine/threonine-protein kinase 10-like [Amphimedon queenslandica]
MSFLKALFRSKEKSKAKEYKNVTKDVDPMENWVKVSELGDGAFGKVYKTEHRETGQLAALKTVPVADETEMEDFMVEIDILSECKHDNIVGLHQAFFYDNQLWIFIEFCPGGAIDDIILELEKGLTEVQIQCITKQLFEGLVFLHDQRIIHRDLKAGNILLCPDGSIRLGDFGVSAILKQREKRYTFIGTPYWMAPEVVACEAIKEEPYGVKADVWSAGITLIEMADMFPPYHETNPMRVLIRITRSEPPILAVPSHWSKDFNDFLSKCLVKAPSQRSSSRDLLSHSFISSVNDYLPLRLLYCEVRAPVEEVIEDLPEDIAATAKESDSGTEPGTPPLSPAKTDLESPEVTMIDDEVPQTPVKEEVEPSSTTPPPPSEEAKGEGEGKNEEVEVKEEPAIKGGDKTQEGGTSKEADSSASNLIAALDRDDLSTESPSDWHYSTLRRQRKFKVDGKEVTTETTHIVQVQNSSKETESTTALATQKLQDNRKYQQMRKQDLREMKILQRQEMKEATEFFNKITSERETQDKKLEAEQQELKQRYQSELDSLQKKSMKELEKLEQQQIQEYKARTKQLKADQSKELKRYRENQKKDEKEEKKKIEKETPKKELKKRTAEWKESFDARKVEQDVHFQSQLDGQFDREMGQLLGDQRSRMKEAELKYLLETQDIKRRRENDQWELEMRHKQEQHQLQKQQVREAFHMQRHQMQMRHQKEYDQQLRRDNFRLDELKQTQLFEKKQLPKQLNAEFKVQLNELRKTMGLRRTAEDKAKLKKLEQRYIIKEESERSLMKEKHTRDLETQKAEMENNIREMVEIQNEKKLTLTQQETKKIQEKDEQHSADLKEWKRDLSNRRQKLEDEFEKEKREKEQYYTSEVALPHHQRYSFKNSVSVSSISSRSSFHEAQLESDANVTLPSIGEEGGGGEENGGATVIS